jgi:hypothetical protein
MLFFMHVSPNRALWNVQNLGSGNFTELFLDGLQ